MRLKPLEKILPMLNMIMSKESKELHCMIFTLFLTRLFVKSWSFISPNFIYRSLVKTTYHEDDEDELFAEVIVIGDTDIEQDVYNSWTLLYVRNREVLEDAF